MYFYEKRDNKFHLISDGESIVISDTLWMLISVDEHMCTVHKHGNKEFVLGQLERMSKAFADANMKKYAEELKAFDVSNIDLEEVNKCLSITGYVSKVYKMFQSAIENESIRS